MVAVPRLREMRQKKLLTQEELAAKAGVHALTIARLENGKTEAQPRTVRKIAKALGVEPEELLG